MEGKENPESNLRKAARVTKNILKSPFKRRILLIAIAIAAVIILCGVAYESLVDAFSDNVSEYVQGNPVQYNTDDNSIVISDETIDGLIKVIEDMGIDLDDMELTREDIAKLYAAEVVSSEINRGVPEEAGKYYGRVYIKRLNPDTGELEMLNYEPSLETFEQMDASQILNYYSMDGDKICIANTNTSTDAEGNTTSRVSINKLSYKDNISQYTVPIEFLLDLCLISQNPGFVLALADKIINETEIVIQVLQNKTTVQTDTTYTYTTETETSTRRMEYDSAGNYLSSSTTPADPVISDADPITTTESQTNVSSTIKIQSVKSWIMEVVYTYNRVDTTDVQTPDPELIEDEEKPAHQYAYSNRETNSDGSYTDIYTSTISRKINQSKSYKITTTSEMYQSGVSEGVKDRVDEFIEMLRTPYSIPSSGIKEAAIDNLENGAEMLFQMLRNGQRTQSLEQLMRYILGKATGNDYGVSEFNFSIFDIKDFSEYNGNVIGNTIEDKIWFSLRNLGYSEYAVAGVMGNIKWESGGFNISAVESNGKGIGLCQWSGSRKTALINYATSKGTTWEDENIQVEFLIGEMTPGGGADGYATYQFMNNEGYTREMWENATSASDAATAFCYSFERPGVPHLKERQDYAEEYYEKYKGLEAYSGATDYVKVGGYTFPQYLQKNYDYAYGSSTIPRSGCGPTSLAMVLAGLMNNPGITPITVVQSLESYYSSWRSYYEPGVGTIWGGMLNNDFLAKHYGVKATAVGTESGIQQVESGKVAIGSVSGHILAIVPVPDQYKNQGYRFYVIDSARGLDGPYRSSSEVIAKPKSGGVFYVRYIIEPIQ